MAKDARGGRRAGRGRDAAGAEARGAGAGPEGAPPAGPAGDDAEGDMINSEIEQRMIDVDSGKRKLTSYGSIEEYIRHVDEVLNG